MSIADHETRRFSRTEYNRMAELGFFDEQRVELVDGEILTISPQTDPHARTITIINGFFSRLLPERYSVRVQLPLAVNDQNEPEPDLAIIDEDPRILRGHPTTALLVVEVALTSLAFDRRKASLYASANIPEYWILNLVDRRLELFRAPTADPSVKFGARYTDTRNVGLGENLRLAVLPPLEITVEKLFPLA